MGGSTQEEQDNENNKTLKKQMARLKEILTPSLKEVAAETDLRVEQFEGRLLVCSPMWRKALSVESTFCRALVENGYLTGEQMQRAAQRYRLGATRQGGVIFWQINEHGEICDGKVMYYRPDCHRDKQHKPLGVGSILTRRHQWADAKRMTSRHCFFGLHLLENVKMKKCKNEKMEKCKNEKMEKVAVVESEKTAVIMSERYPDVLWLAAGGLYELTAVKLFPLRGRRIILFPDTDIEGHAYVTWYRVMLQAQLLLGQTIHLSPLLEQHATPEQKAAKIDIADFIMHNT